MTIPGLPDPPDLPDIEVPNIDPLSLFATLRADIPLLLLPVRLETRFYRNPNRLRIRIYPDQIHVNNHQTALSEREIELGLRFWQIVWNASSAKTTRVFEKLSQLLGVWRATWVMESTTPTNIADIGTGQPVFPTLEAGYIVGAPAHLDLLPSRWIAIGLLNNETMFVEASELIPTALRFAPFQMHSSDDLDRWMIDFEAAQRKGMAIEVQLSDSAEAVIDQGLDELIVVGVRYGNADTLAQSLEDTLRSHYYTRGFDFVPQGTPTNNTETVRTPWQWESADGESVLQRAWQPETAAADSYRQRFAQALGLDQNGIVARALQGAALDIPGMEGMNQALWYLMWGEYLRFVLHDGQKAVLSEASIDWLRDWFIHHVRGGAIYPAFHVGSMPYGILPIQLQPDPLDAHTEEEYLQWALWRLRPGWERSLPNVPHLDPTVTTSATDAPITTDLEQENDNLIGLLSSHPHPVSFFTRGLNNLRTWPFWSMFFDPVGLYERLKDRLITLTATVEGIWSDDIEHDMPNPFDSLATELDYYQDLLEELDGRVSDLTRQIDDFGRPPPVEARDEVDALIAKRDTVDIDIRSVIHEILDRLQYHADRVYPVNSLGLLPVMDVLSAETPNPEHFYFAYELTNRAWGDLPLVQAADAQDGATAAVYLGWLSDYARGSVSGTGPDGMSDPAPLLFQLIKRSINRANAWDNSLLVEFDHFLGTINALSQVNSRATRVNETRRLVDSEPLLTGVTNLLTSTLQGSPTDPNRMAVATVPRQAFSTAATQLREYEQVSRKTTDSFSRLVDILDQWAGQPAPDLDFEPAWGDMVYLPAQTGMRVTQLANAIDVLAVLTTDELELRMKETLGLAMHRLDAWITAYAEDHVNTLRTSNPTGIQIGGFGWVENLRPDAAGTSPSQGYIHAPSMTQAATAAVLRSGYSAYSDGTATSPLSVDLRSDRVRVAQWMMDGVRQGQTVNELLGYRFERYLHDASLDLWIDPVRQVVTDHGTTELAADRVTPIVDGLALLELWDEGAGTLENLIEKPADDTGTPRSFGDIIPALEHLVGITDSMADLALAESVHALVQGDYERASAVQNASAFGDVAPPEVRSVLTPNSGMTITHRLMLLPQAVDHGWKDRQLSKRAKVEPALEAWVASIVGLPEHIRYGVFGDVDQALEFGSLANLSLSALDAVYLAPVPSDRAIISSGLGRWIALDYKQRHPHDTNITIKADIEVNVAEMSLADFILLANSLRQVLSSARPATATDFMLGDGGPIEAATVAELQQRAVLLYDDFVAAVAALEDTTRNLYEVMVYLSFYNLPQSIPVSTDPTALAAQSASILLGAQTRRDETQAKFRRLHENRETNSAGQNIRAARELIAAVLGREYPVMLRFPLPLEPGIIRHEAALTEGDSHAVIGWLLKMARVRSDLISIREMITAAETLRDQSLFFFGIAQVPHVASEPWAGLARPNDQGADRLSLVLTSNVEVAMLGGEVGGLVLDQWVERIPSNYEMTGVTFHFDAPTSRPPQCLLLAVPPKNGAWNFDLVVATVREAFARARLRAVAPETLGEYGHQVPAVYLTSNIDTMGATDGG